MPDKRKKQFYIVSEKGRLVHLLSALPPAILLILIAGGNLLAAAGAICGVSESWKGKSSDFPRPPVRGLGWYMVMPDSLRGHTSTISNRDDSF